MRLEPLVRPPCRRDASAQVDEGLVRNIDIEGANGFVFGRCAQAADGGLGIGGRNHLRVVGGPEQDKAECPCGRDGDKTEAPGGG